MSKYILTADWHIRATTPINRKDDYVEAQFDKIKQVLAIAEMYNADIIIAGDLFDKPVVPIWLLNRLIDTLLHKYSSKIYVIPGNHDLIGHNSERIAETSLWTLETCGGVDYLHTLKNPSSGVSLTGFWFGINNGPENMGEKFPQVKSDMVVLHEPVFEDEVPFYMPKAKTTAQLRAQYPNAGLIVAGDIHIPCYKNGVLVPGSLMRSTIAQKDYKPAIWIYDTETKNMAKIDLRVEEDVWKDVFDIGKELEESLDLKELTKAMKERSEKLDYEATCRELLQDKPELAEAITTYFNAYKEREL